MIFQTVIENKPLQLESSDSLNQLLIKPNKNISFDCIRLSNNSFSIIINNKSFYLTINAHLQGYEVAVNHHTHSVQVQDELDILLKQFGVGINRENPPGIVKAQIPGLVGNIFVKVGDKVKKNQKLFILEAMKMETEIKATRSGVVLNVSVKESDSVTVGQLLLSLG